MKITFKEKKEIPHGTVENILDALTKPLERFKNKIREISIKVKNFDIDKPMKKKSLKITINLKNGKQYHLEKNNISLLTASSKMATSLKTLMSKITKNNSIGKGQRMAFLLITDDEIIQPPVENY